MRNIKKYKGFAFINIFGLALGMACCLMIFLWVQNELNFDRLHENKNSIYQVYSESHYSDVRKNVWTGSYYPLSKALKNEIPEVREAVSYQAVNDILIKHNQTRLTANRIAFADPSFFNVFTFPFVKGDPTNALSDRFSIIITEEMAYKYFGREDLIGKTLNVHNQIDVVVTGVIKNIPDQSSLQFDCIVPFCWIYGSPEKEPTHWGGNPLTTYVLLHEKTNADDVSAKITRLVEKHNPHENFKEFFHILPLTKIHLFSPHGGGLIVSIVIFSVIVFFVLIIACINFMNLNTAKTATRITEVGIRKVVGAQKRISDLIKIIC